MRINFWKITDERNVFPKKLVDLLHPIPTTYIDGNLRDECDIMNPVIALEGEISKFQQYNYVYIEDLHRYYFIEGWNIIRSKDVTVIENQQEVVKHIQMLEMTLHEDVLQSWYEYIMEQECIIGRTEMEFDYERDENGNPIRDDNDNLIPIRVADKMQVDSKWISKPNFNEIFVGYDNVYDNYRGEGINPFEYFNAHLDVYNSVLIVGGQIGEEVN